MPAVITDRLRERLAYWMPEEAAQRAVRRGGQVIQRRPYTMRDGHPVYEYLVAYKKSWASPQRR